MQSGSLRFSEADNQYVTACLGRTPKGVIGVAARNCRGKPAVMINLPLMREGESWLPFPTLYWLVDPDLGTRISDIERKGGVAEIQAALAADDALLQAHLEDNLFYAKARWAVLTKQEERIADELGFRAVLQDSGVGGIANHHAIKCLHAQYAFHLARSDKGTTVGKLMQERYGL